MGEIKIVMNQNHFYRKLEVLLGLLKVMFVTSVHELICVGLKIRHSL